MNKKNNNTILMNMRLFRYIGVAGFLALTVAGCGILDTSDDDDFGDWIEVSSFEGVPRDNAVAFTINGRGYVGTGYDGDDPLKDFWEYDPERNFWIQIADLPGEPRSAAVGFAVSGRGYVGTGYNDDIVDDYLKDFFEYDPETNTWQQIADFGGSARYKAVAFSINNYGYVGTGDDDNNLKDFYRYDPTSDEWSQIVSYPGNKRVDAVAFVIDGRAYVGTGRNNGVYVEDFYAFDPETGLWTRLHDIDEDRDEDDMNIPRSGAVAFSINGKGYIVAGERGMARTDVWEYDPVTDSWSDELGSLEGISRKGAVGFVLGKYGYVTTGINTSIRLDDTWAFDPLDETDEDESVTWIE